jgi:PKD repeat protein
VGSAFSYQITASNSPTSYAATTLPAGLSLNSSTGAISGTPSAAGNTTVTLSATNSGGTGSGNLTIRVAPAAPVISSATTANATVGSAFSYQITASNSPTSYAATTLPEGLSLNSSTGAITGTPTAVGNTTVTLSATNSGGTGSGNLTIRVAPAAPVISSATTANGTVGSAFSYQITASNSPTSYAATTLPAGLSLNSSTGAITGTPSAVGNTTVTLSASNAGGTGSGNLTIRVAAAAPVISSATTANGTVGSAFSYQITASNSPTSYAVSGILPAGLSLNPKTGLFSGIPKRVGETTVNIRVQNDVGATSQLLTIRVLPQAPVIQSAFSTTGTMGKAFRYQITARNSPTSYSVSEPLPVGLSLNATSGLISGTPTEVGNVTITISASNGGGLGSRLITIRILPQSPVITSAATVNGSVGSAFSHQITASNSPTSYSVSGTLPPGLTLDGATGLISGTPTRIGHRKITVRAVNAGGTGVKIIRIVIKRSTLF